MLGVALMSLAGTAPAQGVRFGVGGGPTLSFAEGGGTDFHAMATLGLGGSADKPLGFRIDGMWQFLENGESIIGNGNLVYAFGVSETTRFRPYLIGGAGIYHTAQEDSPGNSEFGINAGAGFLVPIGGGTVNLFGEARLHNIFREGGSTRLLPISAGFMFGGN